MSDGGQRAPDYVSEEQAAWPATVSSPPRSTRSARERSARSQLLDGLEPKADGLRHVVLDLRGLTFMDVLGLMELIRQNEFARSNHHNLALVRGTAAINRVLELTGVDDVLVLVDDPDDLVPPPVTH